MDFAISPMKTARQRRASALLFRSRDGRRPGISGENEISPAVNFWENSETPRGATAIGTSDPRGEGLRAVAAAGRKPPAAGDPDAAVDRDAAVSDCRRLIQFDAKRLYKTASPGIGNGDGPILCATLDPAQFETPRGQRRAKRSSQMGAPFAPVEARAAEDSTAPLRSRKINPEVIEKPRSAAGYLAALIAH